MRAPRPLLQPNRISDVELEQLGHSSEPGGRGPLPPSCWGGQLLEQNPVSVSTEKLNFFVSVIYPVSEKIPAEGTRMTKDTAAAPDG